MGKDAASDADIVNEVIRGDAHAYEQLMARYQQPLLRYVVHLIYDPDIAEDVVQDSFIKAYRNLRAYKPKYKFSSWLYRIAHNEAMNAIKKHSRQMPVSELPSQYEYFVSESHIAERIDAALLRADVRDCLATLQPKYREVILLYYFHAMKYADIGNVLHVPNATVGVRIKRAKDALKTACQQKGISYEG